jgi:hypothetical protein
MCRAGTPPTISNFLTSFVTTELAPIIEKSAIVTPSLMVTLSPIQTLLPIIISFSVLRCGRYLSVAVGHFKSWVREAHEKKRPIAQFCPILTVLF